MNEQPSAVFDLIAYAEHASAALTLKETEFKAAQQVNARATARLIEAISPLAIAQARQQSPSESGAEVISVKRRDDQLMVSVGFVDEDEAHCHAWVELALPLSTLGPSLQAVLASSTNPPNTANRRRAPRR